MHAHTDTHLPWIYLNPRSVSVNARVMTRQAAAVAFKISVLLWKHSFKEHADNQINTHALSLSRLSRDLCWKSNMEQLYGKDCEPRSWRDRGQSKPQRPHSISLPTLTYTHRTGHTLLNRRYVSPIRTSGGILTETCPAVEVRTETQGSTPRPWPPTAWREKGQVRN